MHKTKVSRAVAELEQPQMAEPARPTTPTTASSISTLTKAGRGAYRELVPLAKAFEATAGREARPGTEQRIAGRSLAVLERMLGLASRY